MTSASATGTRRSTCPTWPSFDAVFVTNARGIAPVAAIDEVTLPVNVGLMAKLDKAYESVAWDRI